jgi:hypothetical protein
VDVEEVSVFLFSMAGDPQPVITNAVAIRKVLIEFIFKLREKLCELQMVQR